MHLDLIVLEVSMVAWPFCFVPMVTLYILVGTCGRGRLFTSWWPGSKERGRGRVRVLISPSRVHPSNLISFH